MLSAKRHAHETHGDKDPDKRQTKPKNFKLLPSCDEGCSENKWKGGQVLR